MASPYRSPERLKEVRRHLKAGRGCSEISRRMGVSIKTAWRWVRYVKGIVPESPWNEPRRAREIKTALRLQAKGLSVRDIAKDMGLAKSTVVSRLAGR